MSQTAARLPVIGMRSQQIMTSYLHLVVRIMLFFFCGAAPASTSEHGQVPGYYAMQLGAVRVMALLDGFLPLQPSDLLGIRPELAEDSNQAADVPRIGQGLQTTFTAFLLDMGAHHIMIDAGTSQCLGPTLGEVPQQLRAAGYDPADIDDILITHPHPDHLCGIADPDGKPLYPKAKVWLSEKDAEYWLSPDSDKAAAPHVKMLMAMARKATQGYVEQGRLVRFKVGDKLPGGITLIPSPGHTVGHSSYLVEGGNGQSLLVWGDIIHYHAVQFAHPEAWFSHDSDSVESRKHREEILKRAAAAHWWVAGAHLPFPGIGHVHAQGAAFVWVPTEFSPLP